MVEAPGSSQPPSAAVADPKIDRPRLASGRPTFRVWPVGVVVLAIGSALVMTAGRYGYHRDELYFFACGRHLAWGYPDQGPVTPLLARVMTMLAPGSVTVLRLPAVACVLVTVVLTALLARELGGGSFAQGLAALVVGSGVTALLAGHLLVTATVDLLVWVAIIYLVVLIVAAGPGQRDRLWLPVGSVAGVGLLNKALPVVLLLGLLVGALLTSAVRQRLISHWLWGGAAIAVLCWAPYLAWQTGNAWPQVELGHDIAREYGTLGGRAGFLMLQLLLFGVTGACLSVTGIISSFRRPTGSAAPARPTWQPVLAWAWLVAFVVFALTSGQGYYGAGVYPPLVAAGAVAVERRLRSRIGRAVSVTGALALAAVLVPAALPVLPARTLQGSAWGGAAETQFETVGWPQLVDQVTAVYDGLPASDRSAAVLLTSNYGEAGALDLYGPAHGLPRAYSGLNAYGWWGPPPEREGPVLAIAEDGPPAQLSACRLIAPVRPTDGVRNEETDRAAIYLCRSPAQGWAAAWPRIRHLAN